MKETQLQRQRNARVDGGFSNFMADVCVATRSRVKQEETKRFIGRSRDFWKSKERFLLEILRQDVN